MDRFVRQASGVALGASLVSLAFVVVLASLAAFVGACANTASSSVGNATGDGGVGSGGPCTTEGATQHCYTGPAATEGIGTCHDGTQTCTAGRWGACTGEVLPTAEMCDGVDDSCNGTVDEGCSCDDGATQPCYTGPPATEGVGYCKAGLQTCVNKTWSSDCDGELTPQPETCDGIDTACNGMVDQGVNCSCQGNQSRSCYSGPPATEGVGLCRAGTQSCQGGQWGTCTGQVLPSPEICNGMDDNCNGMVDEGNPGGGVACMPSGSGACGSGTTLCAMGMLSCMPSCTPCTTVAQCTSGQICSNGACGPCSSASQCPAGQGCVNGGCAMCTASTQCSGGLVCVSGACAMCTQSSQCPNGQACVAGACGACASSAQCPGGLICAQGACGPCSSTAECAGGQVCVGGACTGCTATTQCAAGQACVAGQCGACSLSSQCGATQACVAGACGACSASSQCAPGKACVAGACGACSESSQCANGQVCSAGSCAPCTSSSECATGQVCNAMGACGACTASTQCPSTQACIGGACGPCVNSAQCATGLVCEGGECTSCSSTTQCSGGQVCTSGLCGACTASSECTGGQICASGACTACTANDQCAPGQACVGGACGACTAASQCTGGQICAAGACTPCTANSQCATGQACVSGACGACTTASQCASGQTCTGGQCVAVTCPYVYSFDGHDYAYETTVGGASLIAGPGDVPRKIAFAPMWARLDAEVVAFDGTSGVAKAKLLIAEDEIAYVDEAHLTVVFHAPGFEVVSSSSAQWTSFGRVDPQTFDALRTASLRPPVRAVWQGRTDVTHAMGTLDGRAVASDPSADNFYELDFGDARDAKNARLVVDGWKFQLDRGLAPDVPRSPPHLDVVGPDGAWHTAMELSQPRGDRKALAFDLGAIAWPDHRYRMRLYTGTNEGGRAMWYLDRVRLTEERPAPVEVVDVPATTADLAFEGAPSYLDDDKTHPMFSRADGKGSLAVTGPSGDFTRYGDVLPLVGAADDALVILRQGDGMNLTFRGVPRAAKGQVATYFLRTELLFKPRVCVGCAGESPLSGAVFPLPFHGMTRYPYTADEGYPDNADVRRLLDAFDTRHFEQHEAAWGRP